MSRHKSSFGFRMRPENWIIASIIVIVFLCFSYITYVSRKEPEQIAATVSSSPNPLNPSLQMEDDVAILTDSNFHEIITKGVWAVEFYSPYCGYCKEFAPVWAELGTKYKNSPLKFAKVDVVHEKDLATLYKIMRYPTIKIFRDREEKSTFEGSRTIPNLVQFFEENAPELRANIQNVDEAKQ